MIGTFRASARDPKLSYAEALRQSVLAMIDGAKSDAEADPRLWLLLWWLENRRSLGGGVLFRKRLKRGGILGREISDKLYDIWKN